MPRADHRNDRALMLLQRLPYVEPHVGLAPSLAQGNSFAVGLGTGAHLGQGLTDRGKGGERVAGITGFLDERVPECFAAAHAGRLSQRVQGIGACGFGVVGRGIRIKLRQGERDGGGPIDEADRALTRRRPEHRLPLRGELGERREDRGPRILRGVEQHGDGRLHAGMRGIGHQGVSLGSALDQHHSRIEPIKGGADQRRRAGPVVPHAEDVEPVIQGGSDHLAYGAVEIIPAVAASHHVFEVFLQRHEILHGVLDDGPTRLAAICAASTVPRPKWAASAQALSGRLRRDWLRTWIAAKSEGGAGRSKRNACPVRASAFRADLGSPKLESPGKTPPSNNRE